MNDIQTVFIVDDDASVRESVSMMLEAAGHSASAFSSADEFLEVCTPETLGCLILDMNMPGMDGLKLQEELTRRGSQLPIVFLSGQGTIPLTVRTIKSGAMDFLTKPVKGSVLLERVRQAMEQSASLQAQALKSQSVASLLAKLSEREREVMNLVVEGKTSKEVAQLLGISFRTVEVYRAHIMQKTGAANILELARIVAGRSQ